VKSPIGCAAKASLDCSRTRRFLIFSLSFFPLHRVFHYSLFSWFFTPLFFIFFSFSVPPASGNRILLNPLFFICVSQTEKHKSRSADRDFAVPPRCFVEEAHGKDLLLLSVCNRGGTPPRSADPSLQGARRLMFPGLQAAFFANSKLHKVVLASAYPTSMFCFWCPKASEKTQKPQEKRKRPIVF